MKTLQILIVEDNPWVGFQLREIIISVAPAELTTLNSVAAAEKEIRNSAFDFAFLDVSVTNGKTYEIAGELAERRVPFAFVSGFHRNDVPPHLRNAPFVPKPIRQADIRALLGPLID